MPPASQPFSFKTPGAGRKGAKKSSALRPPTSTGKQRKQPTRPRARRRSLTQDLTDTTVLIDYRAGSKELIKYPPFDECGELCEIKNAKGEAAGDVVFYGNGASGRVSIGVEVKSVDDLMSSSSNGRLQGTQLPVMLDEYDVVWLLYYGDVRPAPGSQALQIWRKGQWRNHYVGNRAVPYSYFTGFIISLQEIGISVAHARDVGEAAAWLGELVRWRIKPWSKHKSLKQFDRSRKVTQAHANNANGKQANRAGLMPTLDERTRMRAQVAVELSSVGYKRALAAAEVWCIAEMVVGRRLTKQEQASVASQWAELTTEDKETGAKKRLGPVAAEAIVRALNW